jgi:hypothetical protein
VHFDGLIGDAVKPTNVELLGLIGFTFSHTNPLLFKFAAVLRLNGLRPARMLLTST